MPFSVRMTPDFAPIPMQLPSECPIHLMSEYSIHLMSEYPIHLVSECPIHSMSESSIHLPSTYPIHLKRELSAVQKVKNRYLGKLTPCYFTTFHHTFPKDKMKGKQRNLYFSDRTKKKCSSSGLADSRLQLLAMYDKHMQVNSSNRIKSPTLFSSAARQRRSRQSA